MIHQNYLKEDLPLSHQQGHHFVIGVRRAIQVDKYNNACRIQRTLSILGIHSVEINHMFVSV
jgi:predicted RNase H-like nuclease